MLARRKAEKEHALRALLAEEERAMRRAERTARTAHNALGQAARAAMCTSKRLKAHMTAGHVVGLGSVALQGAALQLCDLSREAKTISLELAACTRELSLAFSAGRKHSAATDCTAIPSRSIPSSSYGSRRNVSRRRATGGTTSLREDVLRGRLRALLACKRSMRARVGRRPAVFRRPSFRTRHTPLARELFKSAPEQCSEACSGSEYLASSGAEGPSGLPTRQTAMPGRETAAVLRIVCVYIADAGADVLAKGEGARRSCESLLRSTVSALH